MLKLYVYDHCPYCVKARMIFGYKNIDFELITLLNDDIDTPTSMIGQKMVPILETEDNLYMPESMDIIRHIDSNYGDSKILSDLHNPEINDWLEQARNYVYKLAMPRWVLFNTPLEEFATQGAIDYFTNKKTEMIGDFAENIINSKLMITEANNDLEILSDLIKSDHAVNGEISEDDIHVFAALRSLSAVKGIEYPDNVMQYALKTAELTGINMHYDIAV